MRKRKRYLWNFYAGIISLIGLGYLILNFPPNFVLNLDKYKIPVLPIFFILTFLSIYLFFTFLFLSRRRGVFIAGFIITYLILRFYGLVNFFFLFLLLILFGGLELFFVKKK